MYKYGASVTSKKYHMIMESSLLQAHGWMCLLNVFRRLSSCGSVHYIAIQKCTRTEWKHSPLLYKFVFFEIWRIHFGDSIVCTKSKTSIFEERWSHIVSVKLSYL